MKKIVQIISNLRGGGAERVCIELHRGFKSLGFDSKIYITNNEKTDYETDDSVKFVEKSTLVDSIKNEKIDLVIVHMHEMAEALQPIKEEKNIYFIFHNTYSEKLKKRNFLSKIKETYRLRKLYKNSNIIAVSDGVKNDAIDNLNIKFNSIQTIYNPFDFKRITELSKENNDLNYNYILNVAALNKVKRQDLLIKAFSKLKTDLHLVILGKGRQEENLKKLAKDLGVEDKVHLLGWVPNPYKYMKNATLYVLSSDVEGFGMVIVESLILNTPVVSTNCPSGPNEILVDELSSYLAPMDDETQLASKIEDALSKYPTIEEKYINKFEYKKIAADYAGLIK